MIADFATDQISYPTIVVAESKQSQPVEKIGVCQPIPNYDEMQMTLDHRVSPALYTVMYLSDVDPTYRGISLETMGSLVRAAKVEVLTNPKFGNLIETVPNFPAPIPNTYYFSPKLGHMGKDQATFRVEVGDRKFSVLVNFYPIEEMVNDSTEQEVCGKKGSFYKLAAYGLSEALQRGAGDIAKFVTAMWSGDTQPVSFAAAELEGPTVARVFDNGGNSSIALDVDAAGHGWFIDLTPEKAKEFLPTADKDVLVAKPGSAAEGKMDMLSVLLHEYGYVLGSGHSDDSRDAMSAVLKPGVRHLLSVNDLALLHGLTLDPPVASGDGGSPGNPLPVPAVF